MPARLFFQVYRTLKQDNERYQNRMNQIASRQQKAAVKEATLPQSEPHSEFFWITCSDGNISYSEF